MAYDGSVSSTKFLFKAMESFAKMVLALLTCRFAKVYRYGHRSVHFLLIICPFNCFFKKKYHRYFIPKFVGQRDNETRVRLDTVFKTLPQEPKDLSVFVKMDIENWEYRTLPQLPQFFDKINGLVVEFHALDIAGETFEKLINLFSTHFDIAHIHANNCGGLIYGTNLPMLLEITFINKKLVENSAQLSMRRYPIKGLDFPCVKGEDIPLDFE